HPENDLGLIFVQSLGIVTCPLASGSIAHPLKTGVSCMVINRRIPWTKVKARSLPILMIISTLERGSGTENPGVHCIYPRAVPVSHLCPMSPIWHVLLTIPLAWSTSCTIKSSFGRGRPRMPLI
ncbi:MAG: hypothetical protein VXZ58_02130, partial [Actinomycetota bacterium]|nr:hypothetical protein [Actinomycetota bacterium]